VTDVVGDLAGGALAADLGVTLTVTFGVVITVVEPAKLMPARVVAAIVVTTVGKIKQLWRRNIIPQQGRMPSA
jgi:hypothetical protein